MKRRGFFGRLIDLWRGMFGARVSRAEAENAEAVYHNAIEEHVRHHENLKQATSRLIYLRNRLEKELSTKQRDLVLVVRALERAADRDEDERALALIRKRRHLEGELERLHEEIGRLSEQTERSKEGLHEINLAIKRLKEERTEMLARKAHALARRDAQHAMQELTDTSHLSGSLAALDNVRESIARLEQTVDTSDEVGLEGVGEVSMSTLRREARDEADREMLEALKRQRNGKALVARLPEPIVTRREEPSAANEASASS